MTADPHTLSLTDLAAAVVRLHRDTAAVHASQRPAAELDLLLAAANRLPGVVEERDAALAEIERLRGLVDRACDEGERQLYRLGGVTDDDSFAAIRKEAAGE